jgi:hypothetical protein
MACDMRLWIIHITVTTNFGSGWYIPKLSTHILFFYDIAETGPNSTFFPHKYPMFHFHIDIISHSTTIYVRKLTPFKKNSEFFIHQINNYSPAIIPLSPTELPPPAAAAPEFSIHGRGNGFLKPILLESILFVVKVPQLLNLYTKVLVTYA